VPVFPFGRHICCNVENPIGFAKEGIPEASCTKVRVASKL